MVALDGYLGGVQAIGLANGATITLTSPSGAVTPSGGPFQSQNAVLRFTGALTSFALVILPSPGFYIIENLTTGPGVLAFNAAGRANQICTPSGSRMEIFSDGSLVQFSNNANGLPGMMYFLVGTTILPQWMADCTVLPYIICNGASGPLYSATTYSTLYNLIGNTFGGTPGVNFYPPDLSGTIPLQYDYTGGRITVGGCGLNGQAIGAAGGAQASVISGGQLPSHGHGINDPQHSHALSVLNQSDFANTSGSVTGQSKFWTGNVPGAGPQTSTSLTGITIQGAGGSQPFPIVQPSLVTGIWLLKT